jgi:hypothetical protein
MAHYSWAKIASQMEHSYENLRRAAPAWIKESGARS